MGRLDDAAKHKVVELRKAGLSFRKIKAVLELDNIKVSAQAIYLYLRELQGGPLGRIRPTELGGNSATPHVQGNLNKIHFQNLLIDAPPHHGYSASLDINQHVSTSSETSTNPSRGGEAHGSSRQEHQTGGNKEENDIQIVSVTSLAQQSFVQPSGSRTETSPLSSTSSTATTPARRRVTLSPATSVMLAARKRLLDRALSHRTKSLHQVASLLKRDHSNVQSSQLSTPLLQTSKAYDLTSEKTIIEEQSGASSSSQRFTSQRPALGIRSLQPHPRSGIRLPNRLPPPFSSSNPGNVLRLQALRNQGSSCSTRNSVPQQTSQDTMGRGSLQDQIQSLGSEVHNLGVAVKMLVEQQCRLERDHLQQTQIQKQILSTLQTIASRTGNCSGTRHQQHNKTPSPSSLSAASTSASFSQGTFSFSQDTYSQCNQTQTSYNSLEGLDNMEAFKVPGMSPTNMNGFPPCSNTESLQLSHAPQTQSFINAYSPQTSQVPYTQSFVSSFNHSQTQTFGSPETKRDDFPTSSSARTFSDCSVSTMQILDPTDSSHSQPGSSIKVEEP